MKIHEILIKIDDNQIFVPAFQREYVWKRADAKNLISSLINEYPTGTMLTWETNNPPEIKGPYKYDPKQGSVKLILDGQQRITTLYMLMYGKIPPYYKKDDIKHDIMPLYVNIETLELEYYRKQMMSSNPLWIHITSVFNGDVRKRDIVDEIEKNNQGERISKELDDNLEDNFQAILKIKDRDFKEQEVPTRATIKEAIDIFYIVNAAGVNLTDAELALAQISGYWPEARSLFKEKIKALSSHGYVFKLDFIIYLILGVLYNIGSKMDKLHDINNNDRIRDAWKKLDEHTLDYIINILKSEAYIDHTKEVNTIYAFIPMIVYSYKKNNNLSQIEIKKMIKWFYYSQIRFRYTNSLQQKLDKDLTIIANENNPFDILLNKIQQERNLEITVDEFEGSGIRHPLWGLMQFYFKSRNAICLSTGIQIRKSNYGKKYDLEWDHIFPYSVLKEHGYGMQNSIKYQLAQEITNRIVLTSTANRSKSAQLAESYLNEVDKRFPNSFDLQCVPKESSLWNIDRYEDFLKKRRSMLCDELNSFLENITETSDANTKIDLLEIINSGENNLVEFKTTLRYDIKKAELNKKLEDVIVKAIAAFSNKDGGTLIMGVNDDLEVVGLDNDYKSLKGDKDEFELHLRHLTDKNYGPNFSANNLTITFPLVEDQEICVVEIGKWDKPLFTNVIDKNGVKSEKFYVRNGNSSLALPTSEIHDYISLRF